MAPAAVETEVDKPSPAVPDFLLDPDAVLKDTGCKWRSPFGKPPDYSKTRAYYEETKSRSHEHGSLPNMAENLVKNWEIEFSWKTDISEFRTIDPEKFTISINGGTELSGPEMIKMGTYNAIISAGNEYYDPKYSSFATSHKTFKRMMPTFAWEVLDAYSPPPVVAIRWRHWGEMKSDYSGYNNKGRKVTAEAHRGTIDIKNLTVAHLDEQFRITKLEISFNEQMMFRQIDPDGKVTEKPAKVSSTVAPKTGSEEDANGHGNKTTADAGVDGHENGSSMPQPAIQVIDAQSSTSSASSASSREQADISPASSSEQWEISSASLTKEGVSAESTLERGDVVPPNISEQGHKRSKSALSSDSGEAKVDSTDSKAPKTANDGDTASKGGGCPFLNRE